MQVHPPNHMADTATPVVEHHLAGDLHLGGTHAPARSPTATLEGKGTGFGEQKLSIGGLFAHGSGITGLFAHGSGVPARQVGFKEEGGHRAGVRERRASGMTHASRGFHWGFHKDHSKEQNDAKPAQSVANSDMQVSLGPAVCILQKLCGMLMLSCAVCAILLLASLVSS